MSQYSPYGNQNDFRVENKETPQNDFRVENQENPACSHAWHSIKFALRVPYCPACGQRKDDKRTLANLRVEELLLTKGKITITHESSGELITGLLQIEAARFKVGERSISVDESHQWFVENPKDEK